MYYCAQWSWPNASPSLFESHNGRKRKARGMREGGGMGEQQIEENDLQHHTHAYSIPRHARGNSARYQLYDINCHHRSSINCPKRECRALAENLRV